MGTPSVVVLFGPALPGRQVLESKLRHAMPIGVSVAVDELPTVRERRAFARGLAAAGARAAFVEWSCSAREAEQEIFHHYAAIAPRYADQRWRTFRDDLAEREPARHEVAPLLHARAGDPGDDLVATLLGWAGPGEPRAPRPRRVLIVEDDPGQRVLLEEALIELGCEVLTAATAEDALAIATAEPVDLVVADHGLPGASGADLTRALRSIRPDLHVAIVTGQPEQALAALGDRTVDVVLAKPVGIVDLIHLIGTA
jgi:CheY-like chemotaxis protein